ASGDVLWVPDVCRADAHDAARAGPWSRTEHQYRGARAVATPVPRLATALVDDADLYQRGIETLVASWEANARGSTGASVLRSPGVAVAVFPNEPERTVYNNALLARGLAAAECAASIETLEAVY